MPALTAVAVAVAVQELQRAVVRGCFDTLRKNNQVKGMPMSMAALVTAAASARRATSAVNDWSSLSTEAGKYRRLANAE